MITDKRFYPFFWTQFFGAFNDNVFKNALVILITFKTFKIADLQTSQIVALCAGLFILPFLLFSTLAGQISEKYPKHEIMVKTKFAEIIIMILGAVGFVLDDIHLLLATLFLMGLQSTFFGPVKYSILPDILETKELLKGNALVEMATFVSILCGTLLGGVLIGMNQFSIESVCVAVIAFAIIGTLFSLKIQKNTFTKSSSKN